MLSSKRRPASCSPTGKPSSVKPQGAEIVGSPRAFHGAVNTGSVSALDEVEVVDERSPGSCRRCGDDVDLAEDVVDLRSHEAPHPLRLHMVGAL